VKFFFNFLVNYTIIIISKSSTGENLAIETEVGTLFSIDEDTEDTQTYTSVYVDENTKNGSFTIQSDKLLTGEIFDFELKSSYLVIVQTDYGNGGVFSKSFTISVIDVNEDTDGDWIINDADICPNISTGCSET
jgi:hypothetical protein